MESNKKQGRILINGKEMTEKDITTDFSKNEVGIIWVEYKDGVWTYSSNTPEDEKIKK